MKHMRNWKAIFFVTTFLLLSCGESDDSQSFNSEVSNAKSGILYVASGSCYAGGVATSTGIATVTAFDLSSGRQLSVLADYNTFSAGDQPVGIANYDKEHLLVLVENTAGRRVDLVRKDGRAVSTYITNATALNGIVRGLEILTDNSLLVSKSSAIERFSGSKARITQGANPYVNAPAAPCATSTTLISSLAVLPNEKIVYAHAAASPNNKLGIISAAGYAAAPDCLAAQAAPATTALPTSLLFHSSGKLLATFGSTTTASNLTYAYDVNIATNVISAPINAYFNTSVVNGPSAMTEDPITKEVLIANGNANFNTIERFSFNPTTKLLTRKPGPSFIPPQSYTRCVSAMKAVVE